LVLAAAPAAAQVLVPPAADPGVLQQREIERERRERAERERRERIERPVEPPPSAPAGPAAPDDALQFFVRRIEFEPRSQLLKPDELEALAAQYRDRALRLSDLRELVARINQLYRTRGIVTAQAMLPPQEIKDGVVRIRLVEGRVGRIRLEGNDSTHADYVTDRLRLRPGMLMDLRALETDLLRFNRSNDAQLSAQLGPGQTFGETDLAVAVREPQRNDLRVFADNAGSEPTGESRLGAAYLRRSVTGHRDELSLSLVRASGHEGYYGTYGFPVGRLGTRVTLGLFEDRTEIKEGPAAALGVTGRASAQTLSLRHPAWVAPARGLDALISYKRRETENRISGTPLGEAELYAWSASAELQWANAAVSWLASAEYVKGSNAEAGLADQSYALWRAAVRRNQAIGSSWSLFGGFTFQASSDELLPSSEQFYLGGESSVRGFGPAVLNGDQGYALNVELHRVLALARAEALRTSGFVFFDHGKVRPFRPAGSVATEDTLSSAGAGLHFAWGKSFSGRAVLAFPVGSPPDELARKQLHFQLVWHAI
jgi:hemolysin activation/secretion protein